MEKIKYSEIRFQTLDKSKNASLLEQKIKSAAKRLWPADLSYEARIYNSEKDIKFSFERRFGCSLDPLFIGVPANYRDTLIGMTKNIKKETINDWVGYVVAQVPFYIDSNEPKFEAKLKEHKHIDAWWITKELYIGLNAAENAIKNGYSLSDIISKRVERSSTHSAPEEMLELIGVALMAGKSDYAQTALKKFTVPPAYNISKETCISWLENIIDKKYYKNSETLVKAVNELLGRSSVQGQGIKRSGAFELLAEKEK